MPNYFNVQRNIELSTISYIETQIAANWSGISVVKSFTQVTEKPLPVICIGLSNDSVTRFELGNVDWQHNFTVDIDAFCTSDGQRNDLMYFLVELLKTPWVYNEYSHASGSNTTLVATPDGSKIRVQEILTAQKLDMGEEVDKYDRFRIAISFIVRRYA